MTPLEPRPNRDADTAWWSTCPKTTWSSLVPTEGVFTVPGASEFPLAEPLVFESVDGVDHSGYWIQPKLAEKLVTWLPG